MKEGMIAKRDRRRTLGIFYTPPELIEPILDAALDPVLAQWRDERSCATSLGRLRLIDPACGSGRFLLAVWRRLAERVRSIASPPGRLPLLRRAAASLHGIDVDEQARRAGEEALQGECARWGVEPRDFVNWFTLGDALLDVDVLERSFDVVIGNPPFVDAETMCAADRDRRALLASRYETARGNWDLSSLFVERAIQLVRPGGRIGLVLPRRLLASDHARHAQNLMAAQRIEVIRMNRPDAFPGTRVETVSVVMQRAEPGPRHALRLVDEASRERSAEQRTLRLLPPGHWSAVLHGDSPAAAAFVRHQRGNGRRILDAAFVGDGATTAEAYLIREAIVESEERHAPAVRLINTGTIDPWETQWGRRPTRYLRGAWHRPVVPLRWLEASLPRRAVQARAPKVLIAGLAGRIEAVVDEGGALCGKSAVQVIPRDPRLCHALCAWLNSAPLNAIYRALFGSRGFGARSMHLGPRQIEQLPLWPADHPGCGDAIDTLTRLSRRLHTPRTAGGSSSTRRAQKGLEQHIDLIVERLLERKEAKGLSAATRGARPGPGQVP